MDSQVKTESDSADNSSIANKEFNVEKILDRRVDEDGTYKYLVQWDGYPADEATWERDSNLSCPNIISDFERERKLAKLAKSLSMSPRSRKKKNPGPSATSAATPASKKRNKSTPKRKRPRRQAKLGMGDASDDESDDEVPAKKSRGRGRPAGRKSNATAIPVVQQVQQLPVNPPTPPPSHPPSTEPPVDEEEEEETESSPVVDADLVFPIDNFRNLELNCKKGKLKLNEAVMLVRKKIGRLPIEVNVTVVLSDSGEEKLAMVVKCNEGVKSNMWKADVKIDLILNDYAEIATKEYSFCWRKTSFTFELPVTLAEVLQDDSPYVDDRGAVRAEMKIQLENVEGYMLPFSRNFFSQPHPHLTNATVDVEGSVFYVDSVILARVSSVFYEAFYGHPNNKQFLLINDCSVDEFNVLLYKIYFPKDKIRMSNVIKLMRLAYRFDVGPIIDNCLDYFESCAPGYRLPLEMVLAAVQISDKWGDAELQDHCVKAIFKGNHFDNVLKSQVYEKLSSNYKVILLSKAMKEENERVIEIQ